MSILNKQVIGLSFLFLLLMTGCLKPPEFLSIEDVKIQGIEDKQLLVDLNYVIYNPNRLSAVLKESEITIYYKDRRVGEGIKLGESQLTARNTIKLPFRCRLLLDELVDDYPELLGEEPSRFKVKGSSKIGVLFFGFKLGVDEWITLDVEEIIKDELSRMLSEENLITVKDFGWGMFGVNGTTMNVLLEWRNEFSFGYKLQKMDLNLRLKPHGKPIARWASNANWEIKGNDKMEIPIEVVLDNLNILKEAGVNMLFKRNMKLYVKGTVTVEIEGNSFELPVDATKSWDLGTIPTMGFPHL